MSEAAITLLHWSTARRETRIADYGNVYEFECARKWAAHIIGASC